MKTKEHLEHIKSNVSHAACCECRADCERRQLPPAWTKYQYVREYLELLSTSPKVKNQFSEALNRRITNRVVPHWRKLSSGYLERLKGMRHVKDVDYLRHYAQRGASCLDY